MKRRNADRVEVMRATAGFTLIELMVVVAVIAILAGIAYPSYQEFIRKTRRAAAASCLLEAAQYMERYYTTKLTYVGSNATWPCPEASPHYDLKITNVAARTYSVTAAPAGSYSDPTCGTLTVTHTGEKTPTTSGCW